MKKAFETLYKESHNPHLAVYETEPEPLFFLREHVMKNQPCVIKNGFKQCTAWKEWQNKDYFRSKMPPLVTVASTPLGNADSYLPSHDIFVLPFEHRLSFDDFLKENETIQYIQSQNDNMRHGDFVNLFPDIPSEMVLMETALDKSADSIQLWIGDKRSISSLHKDPYENMYCVIKGHKRFHLYPPTCFPFLQEKLVNIGRYNLINNNWTIDHVDGQIPWMLMNDINSLPPFFTVDVGPGDVLYLPSLWYHQVEQYGDGESGWDRLVIAVNYWYDMEFDCKFYYQQFLAQCWRIEQNK